MQRKRTTTQPAALATDGKFPGNCARPPSGWRHWRTAKPTYASGAQMPSDGGIQWCIGRLRQRTNCPLVMVERGASCDASKGAVKQPRARKKRPPASGGHSPVICSISLVRLHRRPGKAGLGVPGVAAALILLPATGRASISFRGGSADTEFALAASAFAGEFARLATTCSAFGERLTSVPL